MEKSWKDHIKWEAFKLQTVEMTDWSKTAQQVAETISEIRDDYN